MSLEGFSFEDYVPEGIEPRKRARFFKDSEAGDEIDTVTSINADVGSSIESFETSVAAVVGSISPNELSILYSKSQGNVENAINIFLDGALNDQESEPSSDDSGHADPAQNLSSSQTTSPPVITTPLRWFARFIGSQQAEVYVTRSGMNLVTFDENLNIERVPSDPSNRLTTTHQNKDDIVVRISNSKGMVIGRISEEVARYVSVLIDTGTAFFTATCIFSESRLRIGDVFYIQIHCFLRQKAFIKDIVPVRSEAVSTDSTSSSFMDRNSEPPEERVLRLRQNALVQLFAKLDIKQSGSLKTAQDIANAFNETEDELSQDQLDLLYKRSDVESEMEELEPPPTFGMHLRPYQKKGLNWMVQHEVEHDENNEVESNGPMHPLWQQFTWPLPHLGDTLYKAAELALHKLEGPDTFLGMPDGYNHFYANLYSGELSLDFPREMKTVMGGILADEMGLGKTISTMALIHSNRYMGNSSTRADYLAPYTTLVVAPMSLLSQWESEAYAASQPGTIRVLVYYGNKATGSLQQLLCGPAAKSTAPNVIITSYGTLLSEYTTLLEYRKSRNPRENWYEDPDISLFGLYGVEFYRVVLDEGHSIKNRAAKTSKACYDLRAQRRWILTGTPIVNKLEDLYSLVRFLGVEPWNNFSFWRTFITTPFESKDLVRALNVVQSVMEPIVLRRTKIMKQPDGTPLVSLPPKHIEIRRLKFSEQEKEIYSWIFAKAKGTFDKSMAQGSVMKSYTMILAQILRLRQTCCHPSLVFNSISSKDPDSLEEANALSQADDLSQDLQQIIDRYSAQQESEEDKDIQSFGKEVARTIIEESHKECPICTTEPIPLDEQAVTACWHMSCLHCLLEHIDFQKRKGEVPRCHTCREIISVENIYEIKRDGSSVKLQQYQKSSQSAKVSALISELKHTRTTQPKTKSVVFSQFTSFLDLIQPQLIRSKFPVVRLDGTMSQKSRAEVLDRFQNSPEPLILLISLKAGGVGLNLVCASQVFMMDPWWSFAVEAQAIDRVHRMGQTSDVKVVRFIVENSVEERMLRIQERKQFLASTLGMSEEEKKAQRLEDIKLLFSD